MARPRTFDTDEAVEQAMNVFRRHGYQAASVPRLSEALGIGSGSLYAAFGSKDGLYALALERYARGLVADLDRDLRDGADARTALRRWLLAAAGAGTSDPGRGCLLAAAATERSGHPGTADQVLAAMAAVESVLAGALEQAAARGELAAGGSPSELARFLVTFVQGVHVMGQARADRAFLESAVAGALRALG